MKLDCEAMCGRSTLAHEPDSNLFENNNDAFETEGLKVNNEIMGEAKNGIMSDLQSQKYDGDAKPLSVEKTNVDIGNVPEVHEFMDTEDSVNGREYKSGDFDSPHTIPVYDLKLPEQRADFYTNKSITESKLPELIVHFKEGSYHVVKDICIDEGVPFLDKISVDNAEVCPKGLFSFSNSELDLDNGSIKGMVATVAPISDEVKPLVEYDCETNVVNKCSSKNLLDKDELFSSRDKIVNEVSDEKAVAKSMLLEQAEDSCSESSNLDGEEDQQHSDEDASKEAMPMVHSATEDSNGHNAIEIPLNSKMESEEDPQNADFQQHFPTLDSLILEEKALDSRTASSRSFYTQHGHGESSFSVMGSGPLSSLVEHSGPIPYSGSLSVRSDSSTTSTHSFAFPKLPSEWNSSPVRMAKADRRHYRRQQGWRRYLLCCKF